MAYEDKTLSDLLVKSGKETVLIIELQPSVVTLGAVEITTATNETETVSTRTFSAEESKRYPASINDPARMALSFAGVAGGNDRDNAVIIRGNSPKGLLWMLEGVEIPSPNHFSDIGASNGSVSMLSNAMLANSDFITGAFSAEYGNASSGVFDIKFRNGNNEKREYTFQAGFLGLDAGAEGPFKKGGGASYLFNYRYSSISLFNKLGYKIPGEAIPQFQDLSFKFFFPTKKAGIFSLYGLGGLSTVYQQVNNYQERFDYNLGVAGLSHQYTINDKTYIKSIASYWNRSVLFSLQKEPYTNFAESYKGDFLDHSLCISVNITSRLNSKSMLKAGINGNKIFYNYYSASTYVSTISQTDVWMDNEGRTEQSQAYASFSYRINKNFSLVNGLHFLYLDLNTHYTLEPRSALRWQINSSQSLSLAFGMHSKTEPFQTYIHAPSQQKENQNLDFLKSRHYILGYDKIICEKINFKIETYYQQLYNVPIAQDSTSSFSTLNTDFGYDYPLMNNSGTGKNYGIEMTINRKFYKNYFFLITASLFDSKYTGADKIERNTMYNTSYVSNFIVGKEFVLDHKRKNVLNLNLRMNRTGGRRYTPIDLEKSIYYNQEILKKGEEFSEKMDDYFRIDVQIGYVHNHAKFNSELRLDVQNITNRENIFEIHYDRIHKTIQQTYQLGLIPIVSYRIEF